MGSSEIMRLGELQHMSAGSGVRHSEMNASSTTPFHMLQIWLIPNQMGIEPTYEQKAFNVQTESDKLHLLATRDGRNDSFVIHSDAELLAAKLTAGGSASHVFRGGYGWLQVARGSIQIAGKTLNAGDCL